MSVQSICTRHGRIGCDCASKDRRPSAAKRGYGQRHRSDRLAYFQLFPWCQEQGCHEPATELDHIDGNPENRAWSNYRGYCKSHHSRRTARDQPGGFHAA